MQQDSIRVQTEHYPHVVPTFKPLPYTATDLETDSPLPHIEPAPLEPAPPLTPAPTPPAVYTGPVGGTVHCTDCGTAITMASWHATPKFCPYCASSALQDDTSYQAQQQLQLLQREVNRYAVHPITLTQELVNVLQAHFRTQHAFVSFTEYVTCMLTPKEPTTKTEAEAEARARAARLR